jgi:hypothetical protein
MHSDLKISSSVHTSSLAPAMAAAVATRLFDVADFVARGVFQIDIRRAADESVQSLLEVFMTRRAAILAASLLAIAFMQAGRTSAQVSQNPSLRGDPLTLARPFVLAGPDVGFRVIRMDGPIPVGQVVVRINGAWVAAETSK